jgi:nucleoside-diphosphate-sugar epimerase
MFLVTGGAGFIGSHLVERLLEQGGSVRVFDNFSTGTPDNLAGVRGRIDLIEGDVRDEERVCQVICGVRAVFHLAAISSVQQSAADPDATVDVNVAGTRHVLAAARGAGCQRVVFASSAAVYGNAHGLPQSETMTPQPLSTYAVSKLAGERVCATFNRAHGLETVALRYFNVFGPRQDPSSPYSGVIARFADALRNGAIPVIYGDGEQSRDFVAVADVVAANLRAATAPGVAGRVFNIGSGQAVTMNALLAMMAKLLGTEVQAAHEPARSGEVRHSLADVTAARCTLGYEARVSLETGLAPIVTQPERFHGA